MFENKFADDVQAPTAPTSYTTVVRPHQLKRGDQYTESIASKDRKSRTVAITSVTVGEVTYRGVRAGVLFVTGHDLRTGAVVKYTRTAWDFVEVTREGAGPVRPAVGPRLNPEFVY